MGAFDYLAFALDLALNRPQVLVPWAALLLLGLGAELCGVDPRRGARGGVATGLVVILSLAFLVLTAWAAAATLAFLRPAEDETPPAAGAALRQGLRRTPSLLLLYLLLLLLFGVAVALPAFLVAFVARGSVGVAIFLALSLFTWFLVLGVRLSLAPAANVLDELPPTEAIEAAWLVSHPAFFSLLRLGILLAIVGFLLDLLGRIPWVGLVLSPLAAVATAYLSTAAFGYAYLHLTEKGQASTSGSNPPEVRAPRGTGRGR